MKSSVIHIKQWIQMRRRSKKRPNQIKKLVRSCRNCGQTHQINQCPAYGKTCYHCQKMNHFSKLCRSSQVQRKQVNVAETLNEADEASPDFFIGVLTTTGNEIVQDFEINNKKILVKMDTGAACNIIGKEVCKMLGVKKSEIHSCNKKVIQLDGKSVSVCGMSNTDLVNVNNVSCSTNDNVSELIGNIKNNYSELFDGGLGCLPGTVKIQLSDDAVPVIQAARRVPFSLLPELREELAKKELFHTLMICVFGLSQLMN
ncbi:unnamed protein product [Arctia plantaginis]|uniref:CCHC-type domain-containing protein n=1 Tax=Arctia plantaginis TaxID=874455 RepID=A0A8S0YTJ4_ARCPL|nr:unnamed protein product [Arctia plantaginis]